MPLIPRPAELLALLTMAAAGCSDRLAAPLGEPVDTPAVRGGHVTIATFVPAGRIDPAVAFDESSDPIQRLLFARLLRLSRTGEFVGDLAERFEVGPDGTMLRFHLRRGALFHDGTEVTANDVKRSLERTLHPDTPSPGASFYDRISGYSNYRARKTPTLAGIAVESSHVVVFRLSEPDAAFLAVLTLPLAAPVCRSAGHSYDPAFSSSPCGAGPFAFARWQDQEALLLKRHDGYYDKQLPYLDSITWLFGMTTTAQRFRFERGQLDFVHELSASDSVAFRSDPRWRKLGAWNRPRSTRGIFMNTEIAPFDNIEVRRAVAAAIDRDAVASLRAQSIVAATSMVPSGVLGHDPSFQGQRFDPKAALEHMRRAGWAYDPDSGRGGYPQSIDYLVPAESFDLQVAELFQQQLARIGIRIRLHAVSWAAALTLSGRRGAVRMGGDGWAADYDDPSDFFDPLFRTDAIQDESSQNRAFYSNPVLDSLLGRARGELDPQVRRDLYRQADAIIRDDAPWAVVYGYRYYDVWQGYVRGYAPHPLMFQDIGGIWLDHQQKQRLQSARAAPPLSMHALAALLAGRLRR